MKAKNKDIYYKLGLLKLAMELDNISAAYRIFGYSRPIFGLRNNIEIIPKRLKLLSDKVSKEI